MQPSLLDEAKLERVTTASPLEPSFLGFSAGSWLRLIAKAGPVIRARINDEDSYVIGGRQADLAAWKTPDNWIYGPPASGGVFFREELGPAHVTQLDGPAHRRIRKNILPAFGIAAVTRDVAAVGELISERLTGLDGRKVDLHPTLSRFISEALNISQLKETVSAAQIDAMVSYEEAFIPAVSLSPDQRKRWYRRDRFQEDRRLAFEYFDAVARQRQKGVRRQDSLDLIMDRTSGDPMSHEELVSVVYLLAVAGVGNIANIICAALWALHEHPDWLSRLRGELRSFDPVALTSGMASFPIMKAVIQEVERCYLPAPVVPKMSALDQVFLGYEIPAGANVLHLHGLAHFDVERYPEPFEFDPARWMGAATERANAFGGGVHLCLGMGVTRLYVPLMLGLMSKQLNWRCAQPPMIVSQDPSIRDAPGTTTFQCELTGI